jgi:hypothetical protein
MSIITICVSFIISILGVAFPILLQVVSKLDEKYSSVHLVQLFKREIEWRLFNSFLISSLGVVLLYILCVLPFYTIPQLPSKYITFTITSVLVINAATLIFFFIKFVRKVLIYYSPYDAVGYFINKDRNDPFNSQFPYFKALTDILLFSISQRNETIALTVSDYMHEVFSRYRKENLEKDSAFPEIYYLMIYRTIEELAKERIKKFGFLEVRTVGGIWLLGEFSEDKIHETTYTWIWRNLILAVEYERDDMILQYWQQAHQHVTYNLSFLPRPIIESTEEPKTEEEIRKERNRFLEFHFALGGLLLFKKRYQCIKRIFRFTTSMPPSYELLPDSMDDVFAIYFKFRDPYDQNFPWITTQYYFPETEGINSQGIVKFWVCLYAAVLLIREYSIIPHLITIRPLDLPQIPPDLNTKKIWIDHLDHFKHLVTGVLEDQDLLRETGLDFVSEKWCKENDKVTPVEVVEKTKEKVIQAFDQTKISQTVSKTKEQSFFDTSSHMISAVIAPYLQLNNRKRITTDFDKWFINGVNTIIDKSGFAEHQETEHINFDSFLAESLCRQFANGISEVFAIKRRTKYLLDEENIFKAIEKRLKINKRDHVIVTFGQNIPYYTDHIHVEGLTLNNFNGIQLLNFKMYNYNVVGETFFILKKADLPTLTFREPNEDNIRKYSLQLINEEFNLYGSVIDLNLNPELQEELSKSGNTMDLRTSVFLSLNLNVEFVWKKDAIMIALTKFSKFRNQGAPNELKDVKPFKETK